MKSHLVITKLMPAPNLTNSLLDPMNNILYNLPWKTSHFLSSIMFQPQCVNVYFLMHVSKLGSNMDLINSTQAFQNPSNAEMQSTRFCGQQYCHGPQLGIYIHLISCLARPKLGRIFAVLYFLPLAKTLLTRSPICCQNIHYNDNPYQTKRSVMTKPISKFSQIQLPGQWFIQKGMLNLQYLQDLIYSLL